MAITETEVSGKKFRQKTNSGWRWYSFITRAKDILFNDGSNAEENLSAIKGITSSTNVTEPGYAIDATIVNELKKSAGDGKILVADAITQKGVATNKDDTFATMQKNVLDIPSAFSLNNLQSKKITYKYHHHVLPNGTCSCGNTNNDIQNCSGAVAYTDTAGGCYTKLTKVGTHQETKVWASHNSQDGTSGSGDDKRYRIWCVNCGISETSSAGRDMDESATRANFYKKCSSYPCQKVVTVDTMKYVPDCGFTEGNVQTTIVEF